MEIINKYIVTPNDYVNGWQLIINKMATIDEKSLEIPLSWIHFISKRNIDKFIKCINHTEKSTRLDYLKHITNDFKNVTAIMDNTDLQNGCLIALFCYTNCKIKINCSKQKYSLNSFICHNVCVDNSTVEPLLNRMFNTMIINEHSAFILQLPRNTLNATPFMTITNYKLKIPHRDTEQNPFHIYDYDGIPKSDLSKIEKINKRLHELYEQEIEKYKISISLTYDEFCNQYINGKFHKIYITINGAIITDFLICLNNHVLHLDFYTLNKIKINDWINYVANDDEITINDIMQNYQLLLPENNVTKISEKNLYFVNMLVKNINNKNYAITQFII